MAHSLHSKTKEDLTFQRSLRRFPLPLGSLRLVVILEEVLFPENFSSAFVILVGGSQSETERECSGKKAFSIHTNREPLNGSSFGFPGKNEPTGTDLIYGVERALLCPLVVKRADRPLDL